MMHVCSRPRLRSLESKENSELLKKELKGMNDEVA
jgi:hypothetical protein